MTTEVMTQEQTKAHCSISTYRLGNLIYESAIFSNYFFGNIYCEAIRTLLSLTIGIIIGT